MPETFEQHIQQQTFMLAEGINQLAARVEALELELQGLTETVNRLEGV